VKATPVEEFLRLVRRDLSAEDARIVAPDDLPADVSDAELRHELPGGRMLVVSFASPPADMAARLRRVEMLVDSFHSVLEPARGASSAARPPPARSLHEELRALAERAGAVDAIVIDARSPVVWGAALSPQGEGDDPEGAEVSAVGDAAARAPGSEVEARPGGAGGGLSLIAGEGAAGSAAEDEGEEEAAPLAKAHASPERRAPVLRIVRAPRDGGLREEAEDSVSDRAIRAVRSLPEMATLHKGGHVHASESGPDLGFVARSFAAIYVLILAFRGPFEELRAKRAILHALPHIERLVLALPPQDPAPIMGGVVALRPRLRRRP
jgi:hypothetical protein